MLLPADKDQPLTADELTANKIFEPFGIQIVYVGGMFTLRGNQVGLDAAYLHVETSQQIPRSVKVKINVFLGSFDTLLADCLAAKGYPNALDHTNRGPNNEDLNRAPREVYAACTRKVDDARATYGLHFKGETPDVLHAAKGPTAKLLESP
ncbi:hypothetical protein [Kribbella sp. NPDC055071]